MKRLSRPCKYALRALYRLTREHGAPPQARKEQYWSKGKVVEAVKLARENLAAAREIAKARNPVNWIGLPA